MLGACASTSCLRQAIGGAARCQGRIFRMGSRMLCAARPAHRLTLCLDLDESLIHAELAPTKAASAGCWAARTSPVGRAAPAGPPAFEFQTASTGTVRVWSRPYLGEFLQHCARLGEVVLFTSSTEEYARAIVSHIDPGGGIFSRVLSRRRCDQIAPGYYAKNLDSIGTPLARTVLVDDLRTAFSLQPDNGIPIQAYYGEKEDHALVELLPFLQTLTEEHDVRPILSSRYSVRSTLEQLVSQHAAPLLKPRDYAVYRHPL